MTDKLGFIFVVCALVVVTLACGLGGRPMLAPAWSPDDLMEQVLMSDWAEGDLRPKYIPWHYVNEDEPLCLIIAHSDTPEIWYLACWDYDTEEGIWLLREPIEPLPNPDGRIIPSIPPDAEPAPGRDARRLLQ